MPTVGGGKGKKPKHFDYSPKGVAAAKAKAKKTGQPMKMEVGKEAEHEKMMGKKKAKKA